MKRMVKLAMSVLIVSMAFLLISADTVEYPMYLHNYADASKFYEIDPATGGAIPMECLGEGMVFSCKTNSCVVRGSEDDCWHVKN